MTLRPGRYLYQVTKTKNIKSILVEGLIPGKGDPLLGEVEVPDVLWFDNDLGHLVDWIRHFKSKNHTLLRVDTDYLDRSKLTRSRFGIIGKKTWWKYEGPIPPEAIEVAESIAKRTTWSEW